MNGPKAPKAERISWNKPAPTGCPGAAPITSVDDRETVAAHRASQRLPCSAEHADRRRPVISASVSLLQPLVDDGPRWSSPYWRLGGRLWHRAIGRAGLAAMNALPSAVTRGGIDAGPDEWSLAPGPALGHDGQGTLRFVRT